MIYRYIFKFQCKSFSHFNQIIVKQPHALFCEPARNFLTEPFTAANFSEPVAVRCQPLSFISMQNLSPKKSKPTNKGFLSG